MMLTKQWRYPNLLETVLHLAKGGIGKSFLVVSTFKMFTGWLSTLKYR